MSQFNLADIESSTLIFSSPSLDEMYEVVQSMVRVHSRNALDGLTLSIQATDSDDVEVFDDEKIITALTNLRTNALAKSSH